jgi:cytidylate kinase
MIRVVTVEREFGAGGGVIAAKVAARLGWKLWDQTLTDEIARRLDCPRRAVEEREEKRDSASFRLLRAFMRGSFEGSLNAPRIKAVDSECIREVTQQIVKEVAEAGDCVIVGRGSAYYLSGRRDAFHVFIYAPFQDKVCRLQLAGKSEKEALELAETVDLDRAAFIKKFFNVEWPERHRFHLMVNSSIGEAAAVETILDAHSRFDMKRT